MKVLVVGAGEVGLNIARHLVNEDQDVVVIDQDPERIRYISDQLDVQTICGFGSHPDVLEEAGCDSASMIIAVTNSDEVNMVACQIAYSLFNVPTKIARVRDSAYLSIIRHRFYTREHMPVDVIISPEQEVAKAVLRTIAVPGAYEAETFSDGRMHFVGVHMNEKSKVYRVPFHEYAERFGDYMRVLAIYREDRLIVPTANDHIEKGDEVHFLCAYEDTQRAMDMLGFDTKLHRRALVIGGGNIGLKVASTLEKNGVNTRILERDLERAHFLAEQLTRTTVLNGDAMDRNLLQQENIKDIDVVVAVTQDDATNILSSLQAQQFNAKNVITLVNRSSFMPIIQPLGLDKMIAPREVTASKILQYVRRGNIIALHTVHEGDAEVFEVEVSTHSSIAGTALQNIKLPNNSMIGGVMTRDGVKMATRDLVVHAGDRLVIFAATDVIHQVESLI